MTAMDKKCITSYYISFLIAADLCIFDQTNIITFLTVRFFHSNILCESSEHEDIMIIGQKHSQPSNSLITHHSLMYYPHHQHYIKRDSHIWNWCCINQIFKIISTIFSTMVSPILSVVVISSSTSYPIFFSIFFLSGLVFTENFFIIAFTTLSGQQKHIA